MSYLVTHIFFKNQTNCFNNRRRGNQIFTFMFQNGLLSHPEIEHFIFSSESDPIKEEAHKIMGNWLISVLLHVIIT